MKIRLAILSLVALMMLLFASTASAVGVTSVAAGDRHSCAVTTAGGVQCSGNNGNGQLGNGTFTDSLVPVQVTGLTSGITSVAVGGFHTCAVTSSGGAKCWGNGPDGELGNGVLADSSVPVDVTGLTSGVAAMSLGEYITCALTTTGA